MNLDQVALVNEKDEVIGKKDKVEAHRGQGDLHRAISVFLFNSKGDLLIQQRSESKIVGALEWANTACGNVWPRESYLKCAKRRLKDELGIERVELEKMGKFRYQVEFENGFSEKEIDTVFAGLYEGSPTINSSEVRAVGWIDFEKFIAQSKQMAPWVAKILNNKKIKENLENYVSNI